MSDWRGEFLKLLPQALPDEPMSRHTTFRIGGPADVYVELETVEQLKKAAGFAAAKKTPLFFLGWGSNLLVRDKGIRGVVIRLRGDFERIDFIGSRLVRAGAGARVPTFVTACAEKGLGGCESLVGVPGTIGGALVMNAGTREGEIAAVTKAVSIWNINMNREQRLEGPQLEFGYRRSNLENRVILAGEFALKPGSKVDILERVRAFQSHRLKTQPIHTYNVGSTFKNPPGRFVARLIEEAGLKGLRHGGAQISPKHANFFENAANATAKDVLELVDIAKKKIQERFGLELELEMKVVGEA